MKTDKNNGYGQRQRSGEHDDLPGRLARLLRVLLPQKMSGHHRAACSKRWKNINQQDVHRIHQGYPWYGRLPDNGYHDGVRHADSYCQRLFDDQGDDQFFQVLVWI